MLSMCLFGLLRIHVDDSPKALNSLPSRLASEERKINEITGNKHETGMIIVNGMSHEALLQNMEKLDRQLFLAPDVPIVDGILLNRFIPSQKTQKQDYQLLRNLNQSVLVSRLNEIGFSQKLLDSIKALYESTAGRDFTPIYKKLPAGFTYATTAALDTDVIVTEGTQEYKFCGGKGKPRAVEHMQAIRDAHKR